MSRGTMTVMPFRIPIALAGLLAAMLALGAAQAAEGPPTPERKPPSQRIVSPTLPRLPAQTGEALIARYGFAPEDVGYVLLDPGGRTIAAHNVARPFIPASVAKLTTALAGLEILGGDHRFATRVMADPRVASGDPDGRLWLVGGGDPLLGPDELMAMCQDLRRQGVREVRGGFHYDDRLYASRPRIRADQPEDVQYNPPVSALSLDFNRFRVEWHAGESARTVEAWGLPSVPAVNLGAAGPLQVPTGQTWTREDGVWKLSPDAPSRGAAWLPLAQPAKATAQLFRQLCSRVGVRLPEPTPDRAPADTDILTVQTSPPLTSVLQQTLKYSNNLMAELVGLAAGRRLTGRALELEESSRLLGDWLSRTVPGADWSNFVSGNHSGLNAQARVTPMQLAALLRYAEGREYGADKRSLLSLLPASGWQGGLGGRLRMPETALDVWAKTGTMYFASGLAGYLLGPDGATRSFAVFVNDLASRRAYDADPQRRDGRWSGRIYDWRNRAKAFEEDLLRLWARHR